jgi:hypothetical protein
MKIQKRYPPLTPAQGQALRAKTHPAKPVSESAKALTAEKEKEG